MMHHPVGIRSLAVSFPSIIRTNDYYRENYPELIAKAEQETLARVFSPLESTFDSREFDLEMLPYVSDPFRGTVERRVLGPGESSLTLEHRAAKDALEAAKLSPEEVDLMLVASFLPEQIGIGNAAFLIGQLGLRSAAWNIESMQSGALIALQTACALVQAGEYRNVLVVTSCTYSRFADEDDTLSWVLGDGAGAFVVSSLEMNQGILGTKIIHTASTCGAYSFKLTKDAQGNQRVRLQASKSMSRLMRDKTVGFLRECCEGAVAAAGVTFDQIDFFVFSTPLAWFASFCIRALGIDPERTINLYPQYANIGSVLPVTNLYYAAQSDKIRENNLVLVFSVGASSTAAATVMRWGNVALGSFPVPPGQTHLNT